MEPYTYTQGASTEAPSTICRQCGEHLPNSAYSPSHLARGYNCCRVCLREKRANKTLRARKCLHCNGPIPSSARADALTCSRKCWDSYRNGTTAKALLAKKAEKPRSCLHCGEYMPASMYANARFCCRNCNHAANNQVKKVRKRSSLVDVQYVSRWAIIQRDKGQCYLCGAFPTGIDLTLDHIIPLNKGGAHCEANLAVACAACNSRKGDSLTDKRPPALFADASTR